MQGVEVRAVEDSGLSLPRGPRPFGRSTDNNITTAHVGRTRGDTTGSMFTIYHQKQRAWQRFSGRLEFPACQKFEVNGNEGPLPYARIISRTTYTMKMATVS